MCVFFSLSSQVVYNLLSITYNSRIRIKTYTDELTPLDSVTPLFTAANWMEREVSGWNLTSILAVNQNLLKCETEIGNKWKKINK